MPICDNNKPSVVNQLTENDVNASEAAKVKKTKEQAYFNSYDFDAIEVLPSDEDDNVYHNHNQSSNNKNSTTCKSCQTPSTVGNINQPVIDYSQKFCHDQNLTNNSHLENGVTRFKTNYLQRLSSFFVAGKKAMMKNERPSSTITSDNACSTSAKSNSHMSSGRNNCSTVEAKLTPGKDQQNECVKNDFLLPRAMLKGSIIGVLHSLPMTTIETIGGTSNKQLVANSKINNHEAVGISSAAIATTTITTISTTISTTPITDSSPVAGCNQINNHSISNKNNSNNNKKSKSSKIGMAPNKKSTTASSGLIGTSSSSSLSSSSLTSSSLSSSSSTSELELATASALGSALALSSSRTHSSVVTGTAVVLVNKDPTNQIDDFEIDDSRSSSCSSGAGTSMGVQCYDKSSSISPIDVHEDARGIVDPINSQSHYSTEKSGSSGYYSSNVCSTYSVEDHIYCEPVIDVMVLNKCGTKLGQSGEIIANNVAVRNLKTDSETEQVKINENLRILETSIENLDRHLRNYPKANANDRIASFVISNCNNINVPVDITSCFTTSATDIGIGVNGNNNNSNSNSNSNSNNHNSGNGVSGVADKHRYGHLPTIMEGRCTEMQSLAGIDNRQKLWQDELIDDSLMDIDLDSFLLVKDKYKQNKDLKTLNKPKLIGIDNPIFDKSEILNQEDMENNYKCAKYINSCPEDAYKIESETSSSSHKSLDHFLKKYEDQIHFQNTRELLEDVRDKIRALSESTKGDDENIPQELESTITTLKMELETYLHIINRNSEMEIRKFCSGLVKNENIVKLTNAFERHKSQTGECEYDFAYEPVHNGAIDPFTQTQPFRGSSIRCVSDPNFKMKRKALTDIFPRTEIECYSEMHRNCCDLTSEGASGHTKSQLQRNLSFHKPILNQSFSIDHDDDKDSILEWHKNKPSIWEMYYGSKRLNQTLLGKRGLLMNDTQAITSYPSSRPESDFTLDLPRAEQLRIKMAKEKKFRQRCRFLTTFLCLVFFLLTVMVVSLVLTRGKRMFGSML